MQAVSPICIVHGPFGCGKSSLLVALILYLLTQRSQASSALKGCRVLLSAHTNIAVDRLMTSLMDTGCSGQLALTTTATHVMVSRVCPADTYCIQNHCCTAAIFHIHNFWSSRVLPLKPIAESFAWRVEACSGWHLHGCFPLPSLRLGSCTSATCIGSHCREEEAVTSWTWLLLCCLPLWEPLQSLFQLKESCLSYCSEPALEPFFYFPTPFQLPPPPSPAFPPCTLKQVIPRSCKLHAVLTAKPFQDATTWPQSSAAV